MPGIIRVYFRRVEKEWRWRWNMLENSVSGTKLACGEDWCIGRGSDEVQAGLGATLGNMIAQGDR